MKITILGAGAWGTALAIALAARHEVLLWGRNGAVIETMQQQRENFLYLPGHAWSSKLRATSNLDAAISHVQESDGPGLLIVASAVNGLRPLLTQLQGRTLPNLIWLCKGFEQEAGLLPHQVVQEVLGPDLPAGVLSGPSFAQEVARGLPCALTVASPSTALRNLVVQAVHGGSIRVYSTDDLIGVEVGGAVKNILAIAAGILDGLALGHNARAALITRGLVEISRLGTALGGREETFMGLTGMGDLILTCTGDLSRNRQVGLGLAAGKSLDTIVAELGHVAEGVPCARAVRALAAERGIDMPITNAVAAVLFDGMSPRETVAGLLSRDPRRERA